MKVSPPEPAMNENLDPDRPVLFLDRAIDGNRLADELSAAGSIVRRHSVEYRGREEIDDDQWLRDVGAYGWFVLTRDERIRYRPNEIRSLKAAGVGAFIFTGGNVTGVEMATILIGIRSKIERLALATPRPFIYKIHRDGRILPVVL